VFVSSFAGGLRSLWVGLRGRDQDIDSAFDELDEVTIVGEVTSDLRECQIDQHAGDLGSLLCDALILGSRVEHPFDVRVDQVAHEVLVPRVRFDHTWQNVCSTLDEGSFFGADLLGSYGRILGHGVEGCASGSTIRLVARLGLGMRLRLTSPVLLVLWLLHWEPWRESRVVHIEDMVVDKLILLLLDHVVATKARRFCLTLLVNPVDKVGGVDGGLLASLGVGVE